MSATAGTPLAALAHHYGERGWQLVPTQWHRQRDGRFGQTPVGGVTGGAPFLAAEPLQVGVEQFERRPSDRASRIVVDAGVAGQRGACVGRDGGAAAVRARGWLTGVAPVSLGVGHGLVSSGSWTAIRTAVDS